MESKNTKKQIKSRLDYLLIIFLFFGFHPVSAEESSLTEVIKAKFEDWTQVCNKKTENCVGVYFPQNSAGAKVARLVVDSITPKENKVIAVATVLIPFDKSIVHLPSGVILQIDQNQAVKEQYHFCDANGCNIKFLLTQFAIDLMQNGSNITIKYKDVRELNKIQVMDISLIGFQDLYPAISK